LYDLSSDLTLDAHVALGIYYGHARGRAVAQTIFSGSAGAHFGLVEWQLRF
jgi:hypothetical protein